MSKDVRFRYEMMFQSKNDNPGRILYIHLFKYARTVALYGTLAEK